MLQRTRTTFAAFLKSLGSVDPALLSRWGALAVQAIPAILSTTFVTMAVFKPSQALALLAVGALLLHFAVLIAWAQRAALVHVFQSARINLLEQAVAQTDADNTMLRDEREDFRTNDRAAATLATLAASTESIDKPLQSARIMAQLIASGRSAPGHAALARELIAALDATELAAHSFTALAKASQVEATHPRNVLDVQEFVQAAVRISGSALPEVKGANGTRVHVPEFAQHLVADLLRLHGADLNTTRVVFGVRRSPTHIRLELWTAQPSADSASALAALHIARAHYWENALGISLQSDPLSARRFAISLPRAR